MMIGDRVFREITDNVWDPERRIEEMDNGDIAHPVIHGIEFEAEWSAGRCCCS